MSDAPIVSAPAQPAGTLVQRRSQPPVQKRAARAAFWRMLGLVRPHRAAMIGGILLGFGVALTYATSLVGILPVLKVVVEQQNLREYFAAHAARAAENPALLPAVAQGWAAVLSALAAIFPPADAAGAPMRSLLILLGGLLALNVIGNVLRVFSQYLVSYATLRTMMDLRRRMYRKALRVPMAAITGDVSNTVNQFLSDTREVFLGITTLFGKVAREPLKALCVLLVALWLDWRVTLVALSVAPPAVLLLWYFGRRIRKAMVRLLQGYGLMLGALEETLQGIATVKSYAREVHERRRMWQLERRMLTQQLRLSWVEAVSSPLIEVVGLLVAAAGIIWLAGRTFSAEITPSQFGTMVILLVAMLDPIRKVANVYNMVQRSGAASERLFAFLDQPEEPATGAVRQLPPGEPPAVSFEGVTFRYQPAAPPALQGVNLSVRPGECIAIVGPNGSGKSTLLRLLPRLLEPQEGSVRIAGRDVRDYSLRALRSRIAIVDQRPVIFARTARENIAYGRPDAAPDEVRWAAQQAYCAEFIESWPEQYETRLGEYGTSISGGQRQRIAIARAFLKPASVLIFDEATSEIDAESERKIHEALRALRQGKTTFLIAHRHTVMEMADRLAVMDAGRIVDFGTHAELLARCPLYVALYRSPNG